MLDRDIIALLRSLEIVMSGMIGSGVGGKAMSVEWYTPKWVFDRLGVSFDLDPCSPVSLEKSSVPATAFYSVEDDGLSKEWFGSVWLNPPYGREIVGWTKKMCLHRCGIALVFSRTDTAWCQEMMLSADAVLFLKGRIKFVAGNGQNESNSGAGSLFLAWGDENVLAIERMSDLGVFWRN